MKITVLNCDDKTYLISYHRHDFKTWIDVDKYYMIDGGQFDYIRTSQHGKVERKEISEMIEFIRNDFFWTTILDDRGFPTNAYKKLLKDLTTSHIYSIIGHIVSRKRIDIKKNTIDLDVNLVVSIFVEELNYRKNVELQEQEIK